MNINKYKNIKPKLILEEYFSGKIQAWGQFEDVFGIVRKKFTCEIISDWDKKTSTLKINENFIYDDGVKENRVWKLIKVQNNYYEGTTDNVVGSINLNYHYMELKLKWFLMIICTFKIIV